MTAEEYFESQAAFNRWLSQLTEEEQQHVVMMLDEYATQQSEKQAEKARQEERDKYQGLLKGLLGVFTAKQREKQFPNLYNKARSAAGYKTKEDE